MGDVAMEGGTPVIVLADTAVAQQVVPPSECTPPSMAGEVISTSRFL
jgi:hypothetical protein